MGNVIDQFMWSFQQHFRIGVQISVRSALEAIGFGVEPEVLLVGFAVDAGDLHPICVEPETGPLSSDQLTRVLSLAEELYRVHPDSRLHHSHPRAHELRQRSLRLHTRADALQQTISGSFAHPGLTFFASPGSTVGKYHIHNCIGVPSALLDELPALPDETVDRHYVGRSLQHSVIVESLKRADEALYLPDAGDSLFLLGRTHEIVAEAADRLTQGMVFRATGIPIDVFGLVNGFTSLGYERAGASGRLLFTKRDSPQNSLRVRFKSPVQLKEARSVRKLLQLTDETHAVLVDNRGAFGLGDAQPGPNCVEIEVTGHAEWEASIDGQTLVRVSYGQASLPVAYLDREKVEDALARKVGEIDFERIWSIVEAAQGGGRGMTLVVSSDPEGETTRLGEEAVSIAARQMAPDDIVRFGRVDGAVLLGPDARCYAFGVILDGKATGHGDRARGSRFNSAVRYQRTTKAGSAIIVISDDGTVDLIPNLMPLIARSTVETAVEDFRKCCDQEEVDRAEFIRTHDEVKGLKFYLNEEQCRLVNALYAREEQKVFAGNAIRLIEPPLGSNPEMDESYFL